MRKLLMKGAVLVLVLAVPAIVLAQRVVKPEELKVSPTKYRNSTIKLQDVFVNYRAGIPTPLTAAGYTLDKYIVFGAARAGMRCFIRRSSAAEQQVMGLKKGDRITIIGTVKQPKAKVKRAGGRVTDRYKLDIYIIEASKIIPGWN